MGDEEQRGAGALSQRKQQLHHLGAGGVVEIAGRLIGENDGGLRSKRPGQGHALLLAAGELSREMRAAMVEADLGKGAAGRGKRIVMVEELERQRHVLERRHGGHEMEGLEYDADIGAAKPGELVFVERTELGARDLHSALSRALKPGDDHQQRRFARARAADHGDGLASCDVEIDAAQNRDGARARGQRDLHALELDGGALRMFQGLIHEIIRLSFQMPCPRSIEKSKEVKTMKRTAWCVIVAWLWLAGPAMQAMAAEPREPVIVVLGDSLTAGLGLAQDQAFPAQLEAALRAKGHNFRIVNAGVSGDTAAAGLARLDWAVPQDASAVIVELGANDALQGLPPEGTKQALEEIIKRLQARGLPILLAGMEAPRNMGKEYVEQFSAIFRDLAARYDLVFYPFFLDGVALDEKLVQDDGMHPNAQGVARIVDGIVPKVEALLAKVAAKQ